MQGKSARLCAVIFYCILFDRESMNKKKILFLALFLLIISIPYLISDFYTPKDYHFNGFLVNPIDGHSYLAKMQEGRNGEWLFKLPYSNIQGNGVFLFTYYILLGHIAGILSLPNIIIFHAARVINGTLLFFILIRFIEDYSKPDDLFYTLALLIFGSGLGWIPLFFGYITSDFKIPEIYPFLSSFTNPHFPLAIGLMILILMQYQGNFRYKVITLGILSGLLAVIQPFCLIISVAVLVILTLVEWREITRIKIYSLFSIVLPALIYGVYLFSITNNNEAIKSWNLQNLTPSPQIWDLLLSLAPLIFLAIPGIYFVIKIKNRKLYPIVIWLLMALAMAYFPINLQRRLLIGIYIPVCILGVHGLISLIRLTGKSTNLVRNILFAVSLPSTIILISMSSLQAANLNPDLIMKQSLWKSLLWVDQHIPSRSLILTSPKIGRYIPAYTNDRVIYGHPFETADALVNKNNVEAFFNQMNTREQQLFLEKEGVDYILVENNDGYVFLLSPQIKTTQVYDENDIKIFKVNQ
jgi:hypothetical protein